MRRRDPHPDAAAVGGVDELEQLLLGQVVVGDDQLVELLLPERRLERRPGRRRVRGTRSRCRSRVAPSVAAEVVDPIRLADEQHAPADTDRVQHRAGERLVGSSAGG